MCAAPNLDWSAAVRRRIEAALEAALAGCPELETVRAARYATLGSGHRWRGLAAVAAAAAFCADAAERALPLAAALELGHRHLAAQLQRGEALSDPSAAGRYFAQRLRGLGHEVFAALYLDTRHRALGFEELFRGSIDGAEVHPRTLVQRALAHGAAAVIIGHNHPSGNPEPSAADRAVTARLKQALALVDVRLLDHFVIGDGPPLSMAGRGLV